jgi:transaldolase
MNPLQQLHSLGQSVWLDYIRRSLLDSGELKKMIAEDGLRGMTSNPAIFEKAIAEGAEYDAALRDCFAAGKSAEETLDAVTIEDVRRAADIFRPLHDASRGEDGYVSLEVSPLLAQDTDKTTAEAARLWRAVDRPNVMIKIPATRAGLPAVETSIAAGINVNITLIFSLERYKDVIGATLRGLEKRMAEGHPPVVSSVASFFVSRIDTLVDKLLDAASPREAAALLKGKTAVANAKLAYQLFRKSFNGARWTALKARGARVQRPLWASTGTKNPAYSDVLYVEELIGPDTVNTLPPATVQAFKDHGRPRLSLEDKIAEAARVLEDLRPLQIDLAAVTDRLEAEGVALFADAHHKLLKTLAEKKDRLLKTPA